MPEIKNYTITQTRKIRISATTSTEALACAQLLLDAKAGIIGSARVLGSAKVIQIIIDEE